MDQHSRMTRCNETQVASVNIKFQQISQMHQLASASENNIRQYLIVTNLSEQQHHSCKDKYCFLYEADLTTTMSKSTKQCLTLNQIDSTELACNDYYAAILVCCRFCKLPVLGKHFISKIKSFINIY